MSPSHVPLDNTAARVEDDFFPSRREVYADCEHIDIEYANPLALIASQGTSNSSEQSCAKDCKAFVGRGPWRETAAETGVQGDYTPTNTSHGSGKPLFQRKVAFQGAMASTSMLVSQSVIKSN